MKKRYLSSSDGAVGLHPIEKKLGTTDLDSIFLILLCVLLIKKAIKSVLSDELSAFTQRQPPLNIQYRASIDMCPKAKFLKKKQKCGHMGSTLVAEL